LYVLTGFECPFLEIDFFFLVSIFFSQDRGKTPRVLNNAKRIIDLKESLPLEVDDMGWFWNVVKASGLYPLLQTNYGQVDHV